MGHQAVNHKAHDGGALVVGARQPLAPHFHQPFDRGGRPGDEPAALPLEDDAVISHQPREQAARVGKADQRARQARLAAAGGPANEDAGFADDNTAGMNCFAHAGPLTQDG